MDLDASSSRDLYERLYVKIVQSHRHVAGLMVVKRNSSDGFHQGYSGAEIGGTDAITTRLWALFRMHEARMNLISWWDWSAQHR